MRQPQRVVVMRGGSSRALVFRGEDLPTEIAAQDRIFLAALGCPDPTGRQVDGLGGGASSNNKVAIVGPSKAPGIDVDFTFGQLAPDRALVDRAGNCGNISAAIGPFAIEEGIVAGTDPLTKVTIRNTNTDSTLVAHVPTPAGRFVPDGDFEIAGVPGSGSRIMLDFVEPDRSGAALPLPTGRPSDRLATARAQSFKCSLVDVSKPCVFTPFSELGLEPEVRPEQLDADGAMLALIEELRAAGSVAMGVATDTATATATIPSVPQLTFFAPGDPDCLRVLGISMGKAHRALPLTAAICIAAAAAIRGTLVEEAVHRRAIAGGPLVLQHPTGQIEVTTSLKRDAGNGPRFERISVARTARRLFDGVVQV